MNNIRLNSVFTFSGEPYNGKLRFVVNEQGREAVCRTERKKSIFKGRLQLHKIDDEITVEVKGKIIGHLSLTTFKQLIN